MYPKIQSREPGDDDAVMLPTNLSRFHSNPLGRLAERRTWLCAPNYSHSHSTNTSPQSQHHV